MPILAPRCLGSAVIVSVVSAAAFGAVPVATAVPVAAEDIYCLLSQVFFGEYSCLSKDSELAGRVPCVLDSCSTRRRGTSIPESFNGYVNVRISD
jgi:hypothetical protein